jgi:hypothetical protein
MCVTVSVDIFTHYTSLVSKIRLGIEHTISLENQHTVQVSKSSYRSIQLLYRAVYRMMRCDSVRQSADFRPGSSTARAGGILRSAARSVSVQQSRVDPVREVLLIYCRQETIDNVAV